MIDWTKEREATVNRIAMESSRRMAGADFRVDSWAVARRPLTMAEIVGRLSDEMQALSKTIVGEAP